MTKHAPTISADSNDKDCPDVVGESIRLLRKARADGRLYVYLPPKTAEVFFASQPADNLPEAPPPPPALDTPAKPAPINSPAATTAFSPKAPADADISHLDLTQLATQVSTCRKCPLCESRTQTVFGEGSPQARLMFIGEGPGSEEDLQARPFMGEAGQLLNQMIQAMQFTRDEVYLANVVKCRPPDRRPPSEEESQTCLPYLDRQINLIRPRVIVLLGAVPLKAMFNLTGINSQHGQWQEYKGIPTMPTFHPAYLMRMPKKKRDAWEDLQKVMRVLGKDPADTPSRR